MHDVVAGKPVAGGHVFVDCLGGIFFEGLVNLCNCIAEAVEIDMFCHNTPVKMVLFVNRSICNKYAEHRFTNLLNDRLMIPHVVGGGSTLITMGPISPQGLYQSNCQLVLSAKRLLRQADSSTSRPEFIGVGGIYATTGGKYINSCRKKIAIFFILYERISYGG